MKKQANILHRLALQGRSHLQSEVNRSLLGTHSTKQGKTHGTTPRHETRKNCAAPNKEERRSTKRGKTLRHHTRKNSTAPNKEELHGTKQGRTPLYATRKNSTAPNKEEVRSTKRGRTPQHETRKNSAARNDKELHRLLARFAGHVILNRAHGRDRPQCCIHSYVPPYTVLQRQYVYMKQWNCIIVRRERPLVNIR